MKTFEDLEAWKVAMNLVEEIYAITKEFPKSELYGLTSQLRRASTSITGNIAEGFGRYTYPDKANKFVISRGECSEIRSHLIASILVKITTFERCKKAFELADRTGRLLSGLIKSCNRLKQ
ncbi:four helix bundle protein [Patescibacteria group bacterium]|nr:four helix bundle protein [Patescibacteria group bacterium]MBU1124278.1 four helix bundle protein [Patescibacteria group bacterium]MBU1911028.1 four helix bundle protein [Patescibacteria group bacterium]